MIIARTLALSLLVSTLLSPSLASATSVTPLPAATALTLPTPNNGVFEGYLPAMACFSLGNCVAGGTFNDGNNNQQAVLINEVGGVWQTGVQVTPPNGPVARSQGVSIYDASCAGAGSCAATGTYLDAAGAQHTMVVNEVNGSWRPSQSLALPTNAPSSGLQSQPHAITCASVGNCVVVGTYNTTASTFATQGFVANEVNGVWRSASVVVLPVNKNKNPQVTFNQVVCWAVGSCEAVGGYVDSAGVTHAFVVTSIRGVWRPAQLIALPSNASAYAGAAFNEITCYGPATCTVIGTYTTTTGAQFPMAATMTKGVWARAVSVALPADAGANPATFLWGYKGISCASLGNCAFGGDYTTKAVGTKPALHQGFLVNEVNGVWQSASPLPLPSRAMYAGANGGVIAVSCTSVGACTAAAAYVDRAGNYQTMIISETATTWGAPQPLTLPNGATTVGTGGGIYGLRCFTTGGCQVVGTYQASSSTYEGFTVRW